MLTCLPQELSGQWSPDKWDYWLQLARASRLLAADELALARQGIMVGECHGAATFITAFDSRHMQSTFEQLASKIQAQFSGAKIELMVDGSLMQSDNDTPHERQQQRFIQAQTAAEVMILQSPVMQYLANQREGELTQIELNDP